MRGEGGACVAKEGGRAWDTRYGDKINERVVRILLECILVQTYICTAFAKLPLSNRDSNNKVVSSSDSSCTET